MSRQVPVRFGVIGLGMGCGHADNIRCLPGLARLSAVCDADEERLNSRGAKYGDSVLRFARYDEMLSGDAVDAVVVALPNDLHAPVTIAALEAGRHVLCEKPPALSVDETERMFAASEKTGAKLLIGLGRRFDPHSIWLRTLVDNGELGEAYYAKAGWLRRRHRQPGWFTTRARSGGGPLIDLGVHLLDLALWLVGYPKPVAVTAHVVNRLTPEVDVEDLASAFLRFEGGFAMTLEASLNLNVQRERIYCEVFGTRGGFQAVPAEFYATRAGADTNQIPVQAGYDAPENGGVRMIRHFVDCIRNGAEPGTTREQMHRLMAILEAVYEAGRTGNTVRL